MDWSRTKSIFIITFVLLNIFLGYQLTEMQQRQNLAELATPALDSRLEEQRIDIDIDDPDEERSGSPITAEVRAFEPVLLNQSLDDQEIDVEDDTTILSQLDDPYPVTMTSIRASVEPFLERFVFRGEEYRVVEYDEDEQEIRLLQEFEGRIIDQYERDDFHLVLHVNDSDEIAAYEQTYLEVTDRGDDRELLTTMSALEVLLDDNTIGIGTNVAVTEAQLGYYSLMEVDANFQVYAPAWRITIDEEAYYVNAMTGDIQDVSS
ncbi:two-component system regulatory protein YycI [Alkalicoccus chagannorensis]|uniref:two-component system regulatory protein YycI n=1 Tax=Alkalicoccus chagannorensis TaxID=427072 RepID=UPI0003F747CD|nr:two-component system regulatory protein YycI [Alkalicoccus chagannorensis]